MPPRYGVCGLMLEGKTFTKASALSAASAELRKQRNSQSQYDELKLNVLQNCCHSP